jgi:hypothetical protein
MKHVSMVGRAIKAAIIALALLSTSAFAADKGGPKKPTQAEIDAAIADVWGGCWAEVGGSVGSYMTKRAPAGAGNASRTAGAIVGVGCNTRIKPESSFVIGAFARYGIAISDVDLGGSVHFDEPLFVGGRVGYLLRPWVLAYAVGGYDLSLSGHKEFNGPKVGLGLEVRPWDHYSISTELLQSYPDNGGRGQSVVVTLKRSF